MHAPTEKNSSLNPEASEFVPTGPTTSTTVTVRNQSIPLEHPQPFYQQYAQAPTPQPVLYVTQPMETPILHVNAIDLNKRNPEVLRPFNISFANNSQSSGTCCNERDYGDGNTNRFYPNNLGRRGNSRPNSFNNSRHFSNQEYNSHEPRWTNQWGQNSQRPPSFGDRRGSNYSHRGKPNYWNQQRSHREPYSSISDGSELSHVSRENFSRQEDVHPVHHSIPETSIRKEDITAELEGQPPIFKQENKQCDMGYQNWESNEPGYSEEQNLAEEGLNKQEETRIGESLPERVPGHTEINPLQWEGPILKCTMENKGPPPPFKQDNNFNSEEQQFQKSSYSEELNFAVEITTEQDKNTAIKNESLETNLKSAEVTNSMPQTNFQWPPPPFKHKRDVDNEVHHGESYQNSNYNRSRHSEHRQSDPTSKDDDKSSQEMGIPKNDEQLNQQTVWDEASDRQSESLTSREDSYVPRRGPNKYGTGQQRGGSYRSKNDNQNYSRNRQSGYVNKYKKPLSDWTDDKEENNFPESERPQFKTENNRGSWNQRPYGSRRYDSRYQSGAGNQSWEDDGKNFTRSNYNRHERHKNTDEWEQSQWLDSKQSNSSKVERNSINEDFCVVQRESTKSSSNFQKRTPFEHRRGYHGPQKDTRGLANSPKSTRKRFNDSHRNFYDSEEPKRSSDEYPKKNLRDSPPNLPAEALTTSEAIPGANKIDANSRQAELTDNIPRVDEQVNDQNRKTRSIGNSQKFDKYRKKSRSPKKHTGANTSSNSEEPLSVVDSLRENELARRAELSSLKISDSNRRDSHIKENRGQMDSIHKNPKSRQAEVTDSIPDVDEQVNDQNRKTRSIDNSQKFNKYRKKSHSPKKHTEANTSSNSEEPPSLIDSLRENELARRAQLSSLKNSNSNRRDSLVKENRGQSDSMDKNPHSRQAEVTDSIPGVDEQVNDQNRKMRSIDNSQKFNKYRKKSRSPKKHQASTSSTSEETPRVMDKLREEEHAKISSLKKSNINKKDCLSKENRVQSDSMGKNVICQGQLEGILKGASPQSSGPKEKSKTESSESGKKGKRKGNRQDEVVETDAKQDVRESNEPAEEDMVWTNSEPIQPKKMITFTEAQRLVDPRMERERLNRSANDVEAQMGESILISRRSEGSQPLKSSSFWNHPKDNDVVGKEFDKWEKECQNVKKFNVVTEVQGDLFEQPDDFSLAHCVAEDFRMGSGIAVTFKREFKNLPDLLDQRTKQGGIATIHDPEHNRYIYYLVTKKESTGKPTYFSMWKALYKMRDHAKENEVKKIAAPRLGCGLDRLEWDRVKSMLEYLFGQLDVEIRVCNFQQNELIEEKKSKCKLVIEDYPVTKIQEGTLLIYFASCRGPPDNIMMQMSKKFYFLPSLQQRKQRNLGDIVYFEDKIQNFGLMGCFVRESDEKPLSFKSLHKCLQNINKKNKQFGNDKFNYVACQWVDESYYLDDLINQKIITLLINTLRDVDVYVCRGEFEEETT